MPTVFPKNNLPEPAQPWAREVQKQLANVIVSNRANEINNATRDNQLNSSLISLSAAVNSANSAINGLISLGSSGSEYNLNADNINAGTITGVTLQTAASGRRVQISGTSASFYDDGGVFTGDVTSTGSSGSSILALSNVRNGGFGSSNTTRMSLGQTSITLSTVVSGGFGSVTVTVGGAGLSVNGQLTGSGLQINNSGIAPASFTGALSASSVNGGAGIFNSSLQSSSIPGNGLGGAAVDVYASAQLGTLGVQSSSRTTKQNIHNLDLNVSAILSIDPKSFKYNVDVDELGFDKSPTVAGFIAEDLDEAGLGYFVHYGSDGNPQSIPYSKYVVALQAVVRNLNDRITTLENGAN